MGADGHVGIYSIEKLEKSLDKEDLDLLLKFARSSVCYIHELEGKRYITRYWGDNLWVDDDWDVVRANFNLKEGKWHAGTTPGEVKWIEEEYSKKQIKKIAEMIDFAEKECRLTQWEVWT